MSSDPLPNNRNAADNCLTSICGEKISTVEGLVLIPRMRQFLEQTKDRPRDERRERAFHAEARLTRRKEK